VLNRSRKSGLPCLFPDIKGNGFSFSPLSMTLAIGFSYTTFIVLSYSPSVLSFLRALIMKWC
jgi:hypothetical protein